MKILNDSLRAAAVLLFLALALYPAPASAQARVRVTSDQTNIWRPGFTVVAAVAQSGDVLEVVRRQGNWYEVVIPSSELQRRQTGFIAVSRVELIDGAPGAARPPVSPRTAAPRAAAPPTQRTTPQSSTGFGVFGLGGYGWFTANDSFSAVLGKSGGLWYGGGAQFRFNRRYFVEATAEHFQATGERVFVFDKNVYPLGIEDKVSLTPLIGAGGIRFPGRNYITYVGGGAGVYLVRETSDFADDSENVKETKAAYRGLVGVEWPIARHMLAAFELQYTAVPNGLTGSVATAFDESDLGGFQIRARIGFGR